MIVCIYVCDGYDTQLGYGRFGKGMKGGAPHDELFNSRELMIWST
jgi:hypothetical protein